MLLTEWRSIQLTVASGGRHEMRLVVAAVAPLFPASLFDLGSTPDPQTVQVPVRVSLQVVPVAHAIPVSHRNKTKWSTMGAVDIRTLALTR
jgi:hypothetical protein